MGIANLLFARYSFISFAYIKYILDDVREPVVQPDGVPDVTEIVGDEID